MLEQLSSPKQPEVKARAKPTKFPYLAALRPHQWTKNLIVFAAPLFAFSLTWRSLGGSLLAFVLFCAASSSFYLFNDIADVKSDRQHPVKCHRPIASGQVRVPIAIAMALVLLVSSLIIGWGRSPGLGTALTGYALLQIAYNLKLKRTPILDILAIATGFVLRAYAGAAASGIVLSVWFIFCTAMLALFLGVEKRKAELRLLQVKGGKTRAVLKRYSLTLLTRMESMVTTGALMSYALWSSGPLVNGASTSWMMLTFPFVLYGIFRYQMLSESPQNLNEDKGDFQQEEKTERPDEILLTDLPILLTVISWVITILVILGLKHQGVIE